MLRTVASSIVLWSYLFLAAKVLTESQAGDSTIKLHKVARSTPTVHVPSGNSDGGISSFGQSIGSDAPGLLAVGPAQEPTEFVQAETALAGELAREPVREQVPSTLVLVTATFVANANEPQADTEAEQLIWPSSKSGSETLEGVTRHPSESGGSSVVPHQEPEADSQQTAHWHGLSAGNGSVASESSQRSTIRRVVSDGDLTPEESIRPVNASATSTAATDRQATSDQSDSAAQEAVSGQTAGETLTPELIQLRDRLRDVLAFYIDRSEAVERRSPWGVMHALIAYGVDTEVTIGGRPVNAIGWLCWNGTCRGQQLMYLEGDQLRLRVGPGVQGHEGQFLAMLAQSRVRVDYPIRVEGRSFTVKDLIEYEKRTCREGTELTFKLIGLAHYLDTDEKWTSAWGQSWDLPKLIREELAQPVIGAACGGTHRMMGFSYAVRRRRKSGRPMTGQWYRAKKYVEDYHEYTFKLQNEDGSFSTNWFAGPGAYGTPERKLETTGHILEWLVYSLPESQLTDPRVIKAVRFLTDLLYERLNHDWEIGPRGHALHALAIYDERLFGGQPGRRRLDLAQHRTQAPAR